MKKLWIIGGATGLLLLGIVLGAFLAGPIIASASSQKASTTTRTSAGTAQSYCDQLVSDLASRLGVSVDKLRQAGQGAASDVLAQMVKDGKITQAQADQIKQKLSGDVCSNLKNMGKDQPRTGPAGSFNPQNMQKYMTIALADVAKGLHMTSAQLQAQVQSGKSLSAIAKAQGITDTQLQTIVTNAIQDALKQAVAAGDLTQAQANAFSQQLTSNPQMLERILTHSFGPGSWQQSQPTVQQ